MNKSTVFFSWQSDRRAACCRSLIEDALKEALENLHLSKTTVLYEVDRDTKGVAGSPDITATIFDKIDAAACFVADVSIINPEGEGRSSPNPNVLIELGYAQKALGDERIVMVQNTHFGGPEALPFDLRKHSVVRFASTPDSTERASVRQALRSQLESALGLILKGENPNMAVDVSIGYSKKEIRSDLHQYTLNVRITNVSDRVLSQWHLEVELPTVLLPRNGRFQHRVENRSDAGTSVFRYTSDDFGVLRQGDHYDAKILYAMNDERYRMRHELFNRLVLAKAYSDQGQIGERSRTVEELQDF